MFRFAFILTLAFGPCCLAGEPDPKMISITISPQAMSKAASAKKFYLAPELAVAQKTNCSVLGFSHTGCVVLRLDKQKKGRVAEVQDVQGIQDVSKKPTRPMELIVGYKPGQKEAVRKALQKAGFSLPKVRQPRSKSSAFFVAVPGNKANNAISPQMLQTLGKQARMAGATSATPNYPLRIPERDRPRRLRRTAKPADVVPNDEFFDLLWGMNNIRAPKAWAKVKESPVIVAVIDTGIDVNHKDLKGNIWVNEKEKNGQPGVDDDGNGFIDDVYGWDFHGDDKSVFDNPNHDDHGTHVAGTIGAVQDTVGVVGVSWKVKIMPVKFLGAGGGSTDDAIDAINYAVENGATILNNSWGFRGPGGFSPELLAAIENAHAKSVLFVAAAGNEGNDNDASFRFPSSYDVENVIAVASIDEDEELSGFSNFGHKEVDLAAPGGLVLSTLPEDNYGTYSGTSMAAPHVTGGLALMRGTSKYATVGHIELKKALLAKTRKLNSLVGKCLTEGTLDLSFLNGDPGGTHPPKQPTALVWCKTFKPGDVSIAKEGGVVAQVEIDLPASAKVVITGNTSVASEVDDDLLDVGVFSDKSPDVGVRFVSLSKGGKWTGLTIHHAMRLPAGKHVIEWDILDNKGKVVCDGGALTVIATVDKSSVTISKQSVGHRFRRSPRGPRSRRDGVRQKAKAPQTARESRRSTAQVRGSKPARRAPDSPVGLSTSGQRITQTSGVGIAIPIGPATGVLEQRITDLERQVQLLLALQMLSRTQRLPVFQPQ